MFINLLSKATTYVSNKKETQVSKQQLESSINNLKTVMNEEEYKLKIEKIELENINYQSKINDGRSKINNILTQFSTGEELNKTILVKDLNEVNSILNITQIQENSTEDINNINLKIKQLSENIANSKERLSSMIKQTEEILSLYNEKLFTLSKVDSFEYIKTNSLVNGNALSVELKQIFNKFFSFFLSNPIFKSELASLESYDYKFNCLDKGINEKLDIVSQNKEQFERIHNLLKLSKAYFIYNIYSSCFFSQTTVYVNENEKTDMINYKYIKDEKIIPEEQIEVINSVYSPDNMSLKILKEIANELPENFKNNILSKLIGNFSIKHSALNKEKLRLREENEKLNKKIQNLNTEIGNINKDNMTKKEKQYAEQEEEIYQLRDKIKDLVEELNILKEVTKNNELNHNNSELENIKLKETNLLLEDLLQKQQQEKESLKLLFNNELEELNKKNEEVIKDNENKGNQKEFNSIIEEYENMNKNYEEEIDKLKFINERLELEKKRILSKYETDLKNTEHMIDKRTISKHFLTLFNLNTKEDIRKDTLNHLSDIFQFSSEEKKAIGVSDNSQETTNSETKLESWSNWLYNSLVD